MCPGRGGTTAGRAKTLDTRVGKTQRRCALLPDRYWLLHFLECSFADEAIMADALDVEQTSVGCKADLAQLSKILDTAADTKVACVVDDRLGSQCLQQLVILLDTRLLVVDMQRRHDAVGDDAGTGTTWGSAGDLAVEDPGPLAGTTDIEVLADHLSEKDPPGHRLIEHLCKRELRLQDRQVIAIACGAIACGERMWQSAQPLAQQPLDLLRREPISQPLQQSGVCTRFDAVVEGLERNPPLGNLALQVLMPVDAELG